ncbi:AAA family ATPase [Microbacterium sp.]|uniref:AAA family ATPase n=1 Tax=Microbacterium sp. TaxID=51671 RepID=UPI002812413B|nr:AAA family ATPase [Microbacterium sp.]
MDFATTLDQAFKARLPLLYLETSEEVRAVQALAHAADRQRTARPVWTWSSATGLVHPKDGVVEGTTSPVRALDHAAQQADAGVFVFHDLHLHFGGEGRPGDPAIIRKTRETAVDFRHGDAARMLILTSPVRVIPPELDTLTTLVEFPLPTADELRGLLDDMIDTNRKVKVEATPDERERLVNAALGLTMHEAENAFARAMVDDGRLTALDVEVVHDEKRQAVSKSGLLDFLDPGLDLDDVGGLGNLKRWLSRRQGSWLTKAREFGLPSPKGVLITGVPGCGKSLTAKATAASWGLPLLRLDVGRIFSGLVGSSEQNLRTAIATAEAVSPCILWVDEIEKGFSGVAGSTDSGTSARVFGYFLTWLQEKTRPVFVVATANNIDQLPPEFLRKGRFDEIFFVDLPSLTERRVIWRIQLSSRARSRNGLEAIAADGAAIDRLAAASENYSGAEIEQAVVAALYEAFAAQREATVSDLELAIQNMIPLSVTQSEDVQAIREWASVRAVRATASEDLTRDEQADELAAPAAVPIASGRGGRTVDF